MTHFVSPSQLHVLASSSHHVTSTLSVLPSHLFRMDDWFFVLISLLVLDDDGTNNLREIHSRYCKSFHKSLGIIKRWCWQRNIPQCCLQDPSKSAWRKLYRSRNDQGMITLTGFDCAAFASLCVQFALVFDLYTPFVPSGTLCFESKKQENKGREQLICTEDCLGLVLTWTRQGDH
jgi:hypothetical protein